MSTRTTEKVRRPRVARRARGAWLVALGLVALGLAGCGYTLGPATPPSVATIAVPIFNNDTFPLRREVEYDLTDAFRKEIQTKTNLRLVEHTNADLVVYGTVRRFRERTVAEGRSDQKIESNIYAEIELRVENRIDGHFWVEEVRRVEPFSIEAGETFEVGRNRAIANLAERLVLALEYWSPPEDETSELGEGSAGDGSLDDNPLDDNPLDNDPLDDDTGASDGVGGAPAIPGEDY